MSTDERSADQPAVATDQPMTRTESFLLRMGTVGELFSMFLRGGRWWMLPMLLVFVLLGLILVLLQSVQYVAPFIYMVF